MEKQNFLLGRGERLVSDVSVTRGGGIKKDPYSFAEAVSRLSPMLDAAVRGLDDLPDAACPRDKAVLSLTLNPAYIAKSYFPMELFNEVGISLLGSRPRQIMPEKHTRKGEPKETITTEFFASGTRSALRDWNQNLPNWSEAEGSKSMIRRIEEITAPSPEQKVKGAMPEDGEVTMEVVLHMGALNDDISMLDAFGAFLESQDIARDFGRKFFSRGLCFLEVNTLANRVKDIAVFTTIRALRQMPKLRMFEPIMRSADTPPPPEMSVQEAASNDVRVAIFDGGVPDSHPITQWVTPIETRGLRGATNDLYDHGVAVTSAALFGPIIPSNPLPQPFARIDHYRVLDDDPAQDPHNLYEVLGRIKDALSQMEYDFINLSIGPYMPVEDDEVHAWTAVIDDYLARNSTLAAIAVGNNGESDSETGLNRVQVPADCVNALAIGACNTIGSNWNRATYSAIGPGRSPGLIKPDLVGFGGSGGQPFFVLNHNLGSIRPVTGTSYATPSIVRIASGVRAYFGSNLNHLAIRALLVHTAEGNTQNISEVGWGRCAQNLGEIVLCANNEIRVVYQGEISPTSYIRAPIPMPPGGIAGNVNLKATICYKSEIDPHHPSNYTQAGLEIAFRPHSDKHSERNEGGKTIRSAHPKTASFFGPPTAGMAESELRQDAKKWENCLHATKTMRGTSLKNPVFDIHYIPRIEGMNHKPTDSLSYALIISVNAQKAADLYDQIVRAYATSLQPIRPVIEIPITAGT